MPKPLESAQTPSKASGSGPLRAQALIGWRLLALFYDFWAALALWLLLSLGFTVVYTIVGHHDPHANIAPFSALQLLLWLACWLVAGLYAVLSWRNGGQTLGMRPWRLRLVASGSGPPPSWRALCVRYTIGTLSLLLAGAGFWWVWFDRDRLTWHDRASHTRMQRAPARRPAGNLHGTDLPPS